MDTAQWPQGIGVEKLPAIENSNSNANSKPNSSSSEKKPRPLKEQALNCPRCNSTNTKFCYYNNYSLTQPRYFCKTCRRYWTDGGSLRNVPVGGGSRKNKRSSSTAPPPPKKLFPDLGPPDFSPRNPNRIGEGGHDLNLAYDPPRYGGMSEFMAMHQSMGSSNPNSEGGAAQNLPLMELLKRGGGLGSFMSSVPISDAAAAGFSVSPAGFPQEFKSSLGFSVDGIENGFGNLQEPTSNHQSSSSASRILFPFEELKPVSNNDQFENWNGMLAGGSW